MFWAVNRSVTSMCAALALGAAGTAWGAPTPVITTIYGQQYVTVGAPGNRNMLPVERYFNFNPTPVTEQVGRVDYEFRIARTEVTIEQWLPFINTAWRVFQETGGDVGGPQWLGSSNISDHGSVSNPHYVNVAPNPSAVEDFPIRASWRAAAIYCNWLEAGQPTGPTVDLNLLRRGVYDTATFTRNPDGSYNDQVAHDPGAHFWIPTIHEWTKAGYYDPDRYAPGNPGPWNNGTPGAEPPITGDTSGYWMYPDGSMTGPGFGNFSGVQQPVGSFPSVQSPWGALDMVGGVSEWTETVDTFLVGAPQANRDRIYKPGGDGVQDDAFGYANPRTTPIGIRIVASVPSAPTLLVVLGLGWVIGERRRTHIEVIVR